MILIATIGGIGALLFWGLSDYFTGKSGRQIGSSLTTLIVQSTTVIFLLPVVLLRDLPVSLDASLLVVIGSALFFVVAYVFFVKSMAIGPFGIAAPLANAYPLVMLFVGLTFFNLQISPSQFFAFLTIIAGVIMLVIDRALFNHKSLHRSTVFYAIITMTSWGFAFLLLDIVVDRFVWYQLLFLLGFFTSLFSFLYYVVTRKILPSWHSLKYKNAKYAWQAGLLTLMGSVAFFTVAEYTGSVVIPAVITSASPLATSFLAYYRDDEKFALYKRAGAVVIVLGLIFLNL